MRARSSSNRPASYFRWLPVSLVPIVIPQLAGCAQLLKPSPVHQGITQEELQDRINHSQDMYEAIVRRACDAIVAANDTRQARRLTLLWQMRLIPMSRAITEQPNPLANLVDLWTLCVRQRQFLTVGDGKDAFGAGQSLAVDAAKECEELVERIATSVMQPQMFDQAKVRVATVAAENPLRGDFVGSEVRASAAEAQDTVLQGVLAIPLAPFRWLGGVDETAQAIKGFTAVAARLTDVVNGLAADARLQLQLLMLEMEELEAVRRALDSMEKIAESTDRFTRSADALPARLREELETLFEAVDDRQKNVQNTLKQTAVLLEKLEPAGDATARAGESWARTAKAIEEMVASFRTADAKETAGGERLAPSDVSTLQPRTGTPDAGTEMNQGGAAPYDINDYRRAAEAMTRTAVELQRLAAEIRDLSKSSDLSERMAEIRREADGVVERSRIAAEQVADHAAWRLLLVALAVVAAVTIGKMVAGRFRNRS